MTEWKCPITKVLIPLDRSQESRETVTLMAHLLKAARIREGIERISLLYVLKREMHPEYRATKAREVLETETFKEVKRLFIKNEVEPLFERAEKSLTKSGFEKEKVKKRLREGSIADEITKETLEGGCDTVFLKEGKHELKEKLLATVTDTIVHSLREVNIYVGGVKPRKREVFSRILIPVDGSQTSLKAVIHASSLTTALRKEVKRITLLHVLTPSAEPKAVFREARKVLERHGVKKAIVKEKLLDKDAAEDIIKEAQVVVMGKRGMTKLQDLFLGSTSRKVLHSIEDRILILVS
jgi:nucleotide-binding universal stress UspA family protein